MREWTGHVWAGRRQEMSLVNKFQKGALGSFSSFLGSIGPWSFLTCFLEPVKSIWDGSSYRLRTRYQSILKESNHYCQLLRGFWIMSESVKILGAHKLRTPLENRVGDEHIYLDGLWKLPVQDTTLLVFSKGPCHGSWGFGWNDGPILIAMPILKDSNLLPWILLVLLKIQSNTSSN